MQGGVGIGQGKFRIDKFWIYSKGFFKIPLSNGSLSQGCFADPIIVGNKRLFRGGSDCREVLGKRKSGNQ
jgi:hypothetical protein